MRKIIITGGLVFAMFLILFSPAKAADYDFGGYKAYNTSSYETTTSFDAWKLVFYPGWGTYLRNGYLDFKANYNTVMTFTYPGTSLDILQNTYLHSKNLYDIGDVYLNHIKLNSGYYGSSGDALVSNGSGSTAWSPVSKLSAIVSRGDDFTDYVGHTPLYDDSSLMLISTEKIGFGDVMLSNNSEWAKFSFDGISNVSIWSKSTNISNSDVDGDLCIFYYGSNLVIKNRIGSTKTVIFNVKYTN